MNIRINIILHEAFIGAFANAQTWGMRCTTIHQDVVAVSMAMVLCVASEFFGIEKAIIRRYRHTEAHSGAHNEVSSRRLRQTAASAKPELGCPAGEMFAKWATAVLKVLHSVVPTLPFYGCSLFVCQRGTNIISIMPGLDACCCCTKT